MARKRFIVLGLGSFGSALALRLTEKGGEVTGVDLSQASVEALTGKIYNPLVANVCDRHVLEELHVPSAEAVFISLGEQIEQSILAALHAKELDARQIIAKGVSQDHGKILRKLGVDRVIFPEADIAVQTADQVIMPSMLAFFQFDPEYSMVESAVPLSLVGKSLKDLDIRRRYDVYVVGAKDPLQQRWELLPHGEFKLQEDHVLLLMGKQSTLTKFLQLP